MKNSIDYQIINDALNFYKTQRFVSRCRLARTFDVVKITTPEK